MINKNNLIRTAALSGSVLALAAPEAATANSYEKANVQVERAAGRLGKSILEQFRDTRKTADPNITSAIQVKGRDRLIKPVKTVPGQSGGIASYALEASMKPTKNGRLDPKTTTSINIETLYPQTASEGNRNSESGSVFGFSLQKTKWSVCKTEDCRSIRRLPIWQTSVTYKPQSEFEAPGFTFTSPDGSRIYKQMTTRPLEKFLGGDGRKSDLYPQEFTSQAQNAQDTLEAASQNTPIPEFFDPPTNFNSYK